MKKSRLIIMDIIIVILVVLNAASIAEDSYRTEKSVHVSRHNSQPEQHSLSRNLTSRQRSRHSSREQVSRHISRHSRDLISSRLHSRWTL